MSTKKLQIIGNFIEVDDTLTQTGRAADAKATGDAINQMQTSIDEALGLIGDSSVSDLIAGKADIEHSHDDKYYTEAEIDSMMADLNAAIDEKSDADHIHDDLYYTETEIDDKLDIMQGDIDAKYTKPETGIPESDLSVSVQTLLGKANTAIQNLDGYATEDYVSDAIDIHNTSEVAHNNIYYSKTEIDNMEFITTADIDSICGSSIVAASEVTF